MVDLSKKRELLERFVNLKARQEEIKRAWGAEEGQGILDLFTEILPKVVDAHRCSIFINDPESENVWLQCGTGVRKNQIVIPRQGTNVGEVISTGRYKMVSSLEQRSEIGRTIDSMTGFTPRNMLCVPIKSLDGDRVTGAIQVLNKKGRGEFTEQDRIILEKLAQHIEMVIENIFLSQEMVSITESLSQKSGATEWLIRLWVGMMVVTLIGVIGVIIYFIPTMLSTLHR